MCFNSTLPFDALPLSLALLAVFRFVSKSLFLEELLFSRREHKHQTATCTQDISVSKRHNPPPSSADSEKGTGGQKTLCENWMRVGHPMLFNLEKIPVSNNWGVSFVANRCKKAPRQGGALVFSGLGKA
jgi:hypothetical protein